MHRHLKHVLSTASLAAGLSLLAAAPAQAATENFDALTCGGGAAIPAGTGGLDWPFFSCLDVTTYYPTPTNNGYNASLQSPPNVLWGPSGEITRSSGVFTLNSAYLTAAWRDGLTVTVQGYAGAVAVGAPQTFTPSATARTLVSFTGLVNVDRVTFTASGGTQHPGYLTDGLEFALDDVNYTLGTVHPITVTPPTNGTMTCTPNPVPNGTDATCTATPAAGFALASFTGCTQVGTGNTCTLTNVTAPATVSATFVAAPVGVPTLSQWALMLLGLAAAGLGARRLRRRAA